ncbi:MAG TPA: GspH/FimT family pseudopilin [Gallionella sp.]|nr:GspH/FimT family pseudopilin [Gallionella sp.]
MLIQRKQSGFSLIELLIGIAIMAILMGLAMPSFQTWLQNSQIRNAAESIQNGLQRARSESVGRNTNVEFVLGAGSSWTVQVVGGDVIESRSASEGSKDVTVTALAADSSPATTITFNNFGGVGVPPKQPLNTDDSAPFVQVDLDSSVLSPADSQELRVTIGIGGNVRMCDPNASGTSPRAC